LSHISSVTRHLVCSYQSIFFLD